MCVPSVRASYSIMDANEEEARRTTKLANMLAAAEADNSKPGFHTKPGATYLGPRPQQGPLVRVYLNDGKILL